MKPDLGWSLFSREALRRPESQLRSDVVVVIEELRFLALHRAHAGRRKESYISTIDRRQDPVCVVGDSPHVHYASRNGNIFFHLPAATRGTQ